MKLDAPFDSDLLAALGAEAIQLLCNGDINTLASRFGYALSYGREPVSAIKEDLRQSLSEVGASTLAVAAERDLPNVKYFEPNSSFLVAVVECHVPTDSGAMLLVELVVTTREVEKYITLEQISSVGAVNILDR